MQIINIFQKRAFVLIGFLFFLMFLPLVNADLNIGFNKNQPFVIIGGNKSINWNNLFNFPAGCPAGQAVQVIDTALTCIAVGSGGDTLAGTNFTNLTQAWANVSLYAKNVSINWTAHAIEQSNVTNDSYRTIDNYTFDSINISDNVTLNIAYLQNISTTPSNPPDNFLKFYARDDGTGTLRPYVLTPGGTETDLTGGGGGCTTLDCLSDVTVPSPSALDFLIYNSFSSQWVNSPFNITNTSYRTVDNFSDILKPSDWNATNMSYRTVDNFTDIFKPSDWNATNMSYRTIDNLTFNGTSYFDDVIVNEDLWVLGTFFYVGNVSFTNISNLVINGTLDPALDNYWDIGNYTNRWKNLYLSGWSNSTSVNTSLGFGNGSLQIDWNMLSNLSNPPWGNTVTNMSYRTVDNFTDIWNGVANQTNTSYRTINNQTFEKINATSVNATNLTFVSFITNGTLNINWNMLLNLSNPPWGTTSGVLQGQVSPAFESYTILSTPQTAQSWSWGASTTPTEIFGNRYNRIIVNLTYATSYRMYIEESAACNVAGASLNMQYSLNKGVTWFSLNTTAGGGNVSVRTIGENWSDWEPMTTNAKTDVLVRVLGIKGAATACTPAWRQIAMQVYYDGYPDTFSQNVTSGFLSYNFTVLNGSFLKAVDTNITNINITGKLNQMSISAVITNITRNWTNEAIEELTSNFTSSGATNMSYRTIDNQSFYNVTIAQNVSAKNYFGELLGGIANFFSKLFVTETYTTHLNASNITTNYLNATNFNISRLNSNGTHSCLGKCW